MGGMMSVAGEGTGGWTGCMVDAVGAVEVCVCVVSVDGRESGCGKKSLYA
jgi:hypothetical protein